MRRHFKISKKEKTIKQLVSKTEKRVYVYLSDKETQEKFISAAEAQGYTFEDGVKISERASDNFYAVNRNHTVNFINGIGRMAFQAGADRIVRIDYRKYISGAEDYFYNRNRTANY